MPVKRNDLVACSGKPGYGIYVTEKTWHAP
jgi:hypothetical protein